MYFTYSLYLLLIRISFIVSNLFASSICYHLFLFLGRSPLYFIFSTLRYQSGRTGSWHPRGMFIEHRAGCSLNMDSDQLRFGQIVYTPWTWRIFFFNSFLFKKLAWVSRSFLSYFPREPLYSVFSPPSLFGRLDGLRIPYKIQSCCYEHGFVNIVHITCDYTHLLIRLRARSLVKGIHSPRVEAYWGLTLWRGSKRV